MKNVYEQFFYMKYSGGWSFAEAYNLPVGLRNCSLKGLLSSLKMKKRQLMVGVVAVMEIDKP